MTCKLLYHMSVRAILLGRSHRRIFSIVLRICFLFLSLILLLASKPILISKSSMSTLNLHCFNGRSLHEQLKALTIKYTLKAFVLS